MERYELARQGLVVNNTTGPFCFYADAQATIEALQEKLEDLTAKYQNLVAWYDKQNGTPCEQVRHRQEVEALQADNRTYINERHESMKQIEQLQARVPELEQAVKETHGRFISEQAAKKDVIEELTVALKSNADGQVLIDKLMQDVLKLEAQLTQRTAELEAANTLLYKKNCALGRAETSINDLQAELERVRLLSSHNERRLEEVDKKYKELHGLLLALPKVEGEIAAKETEIDLAAMWGITVNGLFGEHSPLFDTKEEADAYAALLQHRQGIEG